MDHLASTPHGDELWTLMAEELDPRAMLQLQSRALHRPIALDMQIVDGETTTVDYGEGLL